MNVKELAERLELTPLALPCPEKEIGGAYAGDLLSWVMGRAKEGDVWATIMTNINVVAVASLVGTAAAVICEDCEVAEELVEKANSQSVNLLKTTLPVYEFCVRLSELI